MGVGRACKHALVGSRFRVPGSTFVFIVQVLGSKLGVLCSRRTSNSEPRTRNFELGAATSQCRPRNVNSEHEPGTGNVEPGTVGNYLARASCWAAGPCAR